MVSRDEVLDIVLRTKVIAVIRLADAAKLRQVVGAIERGGLKAFEITMTTPGALEFIAALSARRSAGVLIGAGTVLDAETALAAVRAGADFIVSPVTKVDLIQACRRAGIFVAPGAFSPTEIVSAWEQGADMVKVFPATSLGPKFFRDLQGPLPQIRLMPTGGVTLDNAPDFIRSGASAVAIGTALFDPKAIDHDDWESLMQKARALVDALGRLSS